MRKNRNYSSRNGYITNNRNRNAGNDGRKIIRLLLLMLVMVTCIVLGISALLNKSREVNSERTISMEEIDRFLEELPEDKREDFRQLCIQKRDEIGYLPYDSTLQELISYAQRTSPEVELGYKSLGVITVSDNSVLTLNQEKDTVKSYRWCVDGTGKEGGAGEEKIGMEQIVSGDEIKVFGTKDKILIMLKKEESGVTLNAAWIMASDETKITLKYKEHQIELPNKTSGYRSYEDIADVVIEKGGITRVEVYNDKIHAKLLSIKDGKIELEGVGLCPYSEDIQVYKLFGTYEPYTLSNLKIGYEFTDFVRNREGEIVAALVTEEGYLDKIRVVIKTTDFASAYHESVSLMCDTDMEWKSGDKSGMITGGEEITIKEDADFFGENRIVFTPKALSAKTMITSITRSQGTPAYRGTIEIERCEEGLLIINELLLDEYLYSVVPSEMPAYYPMEALKAQAVSARTYAYAHMEASGLQSYGAHVDDSAAFQVYNNIVESDAGTGAVRETEGIIVCENGKPVTTYFYSTSCGYGTDLTAWDVENDSYLKSRKIAVDATADKVTPDTATTDTEMEAAEEDFSSFIKSRDTSCYEAEETYYRWKYETPLDANLLSEVLKKRYMANPHQILTLTDQGFVQKEITDIGQVKNIEVQRRAKGGAVTELLIEAEKATIKVISEKNVRYVLANESTSLKLGDNYTKDGSANGMLPSAFLVIEPAYGVGDAPRENNHENRKEDSGYITGYTIWGGGFGHGIGMSQNGAKQMAQRGMSYGDILQFFYVGTSLHNLKEQ